MEHLFFCTRWGAEHLEWNDFAGQVKAAGYDGVESSLPEDPENRELMLRAFAEQELRFIGVHWDTVTADFALHRTEMARRLKELADLKPLFITSHTGKDHFSFEQNIELLSLAEEISVSTGVNILHETHRGKFSFAAHSTEAYLEKLPWLNLTLDISHWYAVAESFLQDQTSALDLALSRTRHIHSRVGFTQGPQVSDPRHPEWQDALQHHLDNWDKVVGLLGQAKRENITFTPEFGPFPYMSTETDPKKVFSAQWDINNYMKDLLKTRYHAR